MQSVKQGGINTIFWVFGMTRAGIWNQVSRAIGEIIYINHNYLKL